MRKNKEKGNNLPFLVVNPNLPLVKEIGSTKRANCKSSIMSLKRAETSF